MAAQNAPRFPSASPQRAAAWQPPAGLSKSLAPRSRTRQYVAQSSLAIGLSRLCPDALDFFSTTHSGHLYTCPDLRLVSYRSIIGEKRLQRPQPAEELDRSIDLERVSAVAVSGPGQHETRCSAHHLCSGICLLLPRSYLGTQPAAGPMRAVIAGEVVSIDSTHTFLRGTIHASR